MAPHLTTHIHLEVARLTSAQAQFGALRSALQRAPDEAAWELIWRTLAQWDEPALEQQALPYVTGHLRRWPDLLRTSPKPWLEALLHHKPSPAWSIVRTLDTHGLVLGHERWRWINRTLLSSNLRHVRARSTYLGQREVAQLVSAPGGQFLHHLDLTQTPLTEGCVQELARADALKSLRFLGLGECRLGNTGLRWLSDAPALSSLQALGLQNDRLGLHAMLGLREATFHATLQELDLSDNYLGARGAGALVEDARWRALRALRLKNCGLGPEGLNALLARPEALPALRVLDLTHNKLRDAGALALARSALMPQLEALTLGQNMIGSEGLRALLERGASGALRRVNLHWNPVSEEATQLAQDALGERATRVLVMP